jgi:chemotaxis-related protein WspD
MTDCWNRIGVHGDSSCQELKQHIHCRNCPVYSAAAVKLLDADPPPGYLQAWTNQLAQGEAQTELDSRSVLVFRVGAEWLALPAAALQEIAAVRPIHSIPHHRNGVLLGLANIRGELRICISLQRMLGLEAAPASLPQKRLTSKRLLVIHREGDRTVCPVDEVHGIERFGASELAPVPATVAGAAATYTRAVVSWRGNSVGLLDIELLFHTVNRSLGASAA